MKKILAIMLAASLLILCGCTGTEKTDDAAQDEMNNGGTDMPSYVTENTDNYDFMKETYGLTDEELEGIDVDRLMANFGFRDNEYTPEEVRKILEKFGDTYKINEADRIFSLLDMEGGTVSSGDDIAYIGFMENSGTLVIRMVFDLKGKVYYIDDAEPKALTDEELAVLTGLVDKYGIAGWDSHYNEEGGNDTTANYGWKLVFYKADGTVASYDGYSPSGTCLPENYSEVNKALSDIALKK